MISFGALAIIAGCQQRTEEEIKEFHYLLDEFADLKVMRYKVPGWEDLTLQQKEYAYYLAEAAKYGRDIRALLLDLDGVVLDTEGQYSAFWGWVGREKFPHVPDFARRIKGQTLAHALRLEPPFTLSQSLQSRQRRGHLQEVGIGIFVVYRFICHELAVYYKVSHASPVQVVDIAVTIVTRCLQSKEQSLFREAQGTAVG